MQFCVLYVLVPGIDVLLLLSLVLVLLMLPPIIRPLALCNAVAQWLEHMAGYRRVMVRILVEQLRSYGNSVYPTLSVSFGGDTESHCGPSDLVSMPREVKHPTQGVNV